MGKQLKKGMLGAVSILLLMLVVYACATEQSVIPGGADYGDREGPRVGDYGTPLQ